MAAIKAGASGLTADAVDGEFVGTFVGSGCGAFEGPGVTSVGTRVGSGVTAGGGLGIGEVEGGTAGD